MRDLKSEFNHLGFEISNLRSATIQSAICKSARSVGVCVIRNQQSQIGQ